MEYTPIAEDQKEEWINWLKDQVRVLNGHPDGEGPGPIFKTPIGDVATGKDLVGNFLALLTNQKVEIK